MLILNYYNRNFSLKIYIKQEENVCSYAQTDHQMQLYFLAQPSQSCEISKVVNERSVMLHIFNVCI